MLFGRAGATVGDEVLDGYDHGQGFDLAGDAASGLVWVEVGNLPETGEDLFAVECLLATLLGFLLRLLLLRGGAVLQHVGTNTGLGFGVGGRVGREAGGFRGFAVSYGS